jgi:hypothetical protein
VSSVSGSLREAGAAARIVSERAELWLPGAVCWITSIGWLPFVLTVARLPGEGDLTFFGAGIVTSGAWPFNAIALTGGSLGVVVAALALLALGEVALLAGLRQLIGEGAPVRVGRAALRVLGIELVAAVPLALALTALVVALVAVAPAEFRSPDIGGALGERILGPVLPLIVIVLGALLLGQSFGAVAARRVLLRGQALGPAVGGGMRELRRDLSGIAPVAFTTLVVTAVYAVAVLFLLRVLWAPIAAQLSGGPGIGAEAALLLVGFVAIWLCLVLGGGAVHAWASVWWTLELTRAAPWPAGPVSSSQESRPA